MRHDPVRPELREKIEAFRIDEGTPSLSFARRLARENGWTVAHAERVIREYKRFAYLAVAAGHPVTPSEAVDQAWHLHLTYTRSYWTRFCRETLGRELHHEPTRGGPDEAAKHRRQYAETLASYQRHFGEPPPRDLWPDAEFTSAPGRWVDTSRCWVVPKPRLPKARTPLLTATVAAPVAAAFNPLDFDGPTFLAFYAAVAFGGLVAGLVLRFLATRGEDAGSSAPPEITDPYDAVYLANGTPGVVQGALTALARRGNLTVTEGRLSRGPEPLPGDAPSVERVLYESIPESGAEKPREVGRALYAAKAEAKAYRDRLRAAGLVAPDPAEPLTKRWLPAAIMAAIALLGVMKIAVGVSRDKPVGFLVLMTVATAVAAGLFLIRGRLTRRGAAAAAALRSRHRRLTIQAVGGLSPSDAALLVGLFGTAYLVGTELMPVHELRQRAEAAGADGSASGCSGGDGGGDGGGGCGGGCGGCGGGD
ncbi:MAG TPA: TIGR04222 domain-containing membrane protein [Planctomycetaceae bacterium]